MMVNATFLEFLEYKMDELTGAKLESIFPIASRVFYQTYFFPLLKLQGKVEEIYFSLRTKQGNDIPMLVNGTRQQRAGSFANNCIFIPIKQRIRYEEEIIKAKKITESALLTQKQAEENMRATLAAKTTLLQEVHHRVK